MLLKDPGKADLAITRLLELQNQELDGADRLTRSEIRVEAARYDWRELYEWYLLMMGPVIGHPSFAISDMDERANRIEVGLTDAAAVMDVNGLIATLGIPADAVHIYVAPRVESFAGLSDRIRDSIPGGYRAASDYDTAGCTLGFTARHATSWGYGFVTASHCSLVYMGLDNTVWYQPSKTAANRVGVEHIDPPPVNSSVISQCPFGSLNRCRRSDAAVVVYDDSSFAALGYIERTFVNSTTVDNSKADFKINDDDPSCPWSSLCNYGGKTMNKVGRKTGWTSGSMNPNAICTIFAPDRDTSKRLVCMDWFFANAGAGDSGAAVFEISGAPNVNLYGVLFGGADFGSGLELAFSRIRYVKNELGGFSARAVPQPE